jgi:hypothetical protein
MTRVIQVVWNDTVIGSMRDLTFDNFFIHGPWQRLASPETWRALLDLLEAEGEVLVELRGEGKPLMAKLLVEPDEQEIELRFDPSR